MDASADMQSPIKPPAHHMMNKQNKLTPFNNNKNMRTMPELNPESFDSRLGKIDQKEKQKQEINNSDSQRAASDNNKIYNLVF